MSKQDNMGTFTLGIGSYTVRNSDGVKVLAMKLLAGGAATFTGAAKVAAFGSSTAMSLVVNETTIVTNPDYIDNFTITVAAGQVQILTNQ